MTASTVALIGGLCHRYRALLPVLAQHLEDNDGEVLPHLVMSDVVRWLVDHRGERRICEGIWAWLETAYRDGDADEKDLIACSGVEMIPDPGLPGAEFRELLGPKLQAADPWIA